MIIDEIRNLKLYKKVPAKVIDFVSKLNIDTPCGRYDIDKKCYVNVETYSTKPVASAMYEAHKKYIDIQIVLDGEEKIYYKNKDKISYPQQFDDKGDIGFYNEMISDDDAYVRLDGSNFAIIYPHEGHAPQIQSGEKTARVKKAVVKLPL